MRRSIARSLSVCGLLLALSSRTHADAKVYHGSACHPTVVTATVEPTDVFSVAQATQGGPVSGQVAYSGYLDCPIVRDVTHNTNGLEDLSVSVVANAGVAGHAECTVSSLSEAGAVLGSQTRSTSTTAELSFGNSLNVSGPLGYYHLFCRLPASWSIARYVVGEYGLGNEGAAGVRAARDAKYHNAAEWCFPSERTRRSQGGYFGYPPDGYTTHDALTCPIILEGSGKGAGLQDLDLALIGPGDSSASCTLRVVSADGATVRSRMRSTAAAGPSTLDFGASGGIESTAGGGESAYFTCQFTEAKDWILKGYRVVEAAVAPDADAAPAKRIGAVGDSKTYTGSFCRPNLMDTFDKSYLLTVSGYYYQVTESPSVLCPLIRDVTNNDTGLSNIVLWLSAPGAGSVGCGIYMLNAAGAIVGQASRGVEFDAGGGVRKIDFSDAGTAIGGKGLSSDQGAFGIACSLPKGFAIVGYRVEEFSAGDSD